MSHDTYLFEFAFPDPEWVAGSWPGGHFGITGKIDGEDTSRKYTQISPVNQKGKISFVIKIYRPCPAFPEGGKFSQWLEQNIEVGSRTRFEGPVGKIKYLGHGNLLFSGKPRKPKTKIALIAGGSGITPMYSIALASSLAQDGVQIWFLYSNKTIDDILCKE